MSSTKMSTPHQRALEAQQHTKLPYPSSSFDQKVIIITGGTSGLGLETARHLVRLGAAKVIITARSTSKGVAAKADIEGSTGRKDVIIPYELELDSIQSVRSFVKNVEQQEERLDGILLNAAVLMEKFELTPDGYETTVAVNLIGSHLLAISLLPLLRQSAEKCDTMPIISFVSSNNHAWIKFLEWKEEDIFALLNEETKAKMAERYQTTKLLSLLCARELTHRVHPEPKILINSVNPGLCHSALTHNITGDLQAAIQERLSKYARTTEEGSRTLVHALAAGWETNGRYLSDCEVKDENMHELIRGEEGREAEKRVWEQLMRRLEGFEKGIMEKL